MNLQVLLDGTQTFTRMKIDKASTYLLLGKMPGLACAENLRPNRSVALEVSTLGLFCGWSKSLLSELFNLCISLLSRCGFLRREQEISFERHVMREVIRSVTMACVSSNELEGAWPI